MRYTARTPILFLLLLALSACGETQVFDSPNENATSTSISVPETSTTQPAATTTSTEAPISTTTTQPSGPQDVCSSELPLDTTLEAGVIEPLPPSPSPRLRSDTTEYFSWRDAIGTESYTLRFSGIGTGEDPAATLIELRISGLDRHAVVSEFGGEVTELITFGDDIWSRTGDEDWSTIEEISHMAGSVLAPASAELWYSIGYETLPLTEFVGWTEFKGTEVAVFAGGSAAAQTAAETMGITQTPPEGDVTLRWDPAGFFRSVAVTFDNEYGSRTNCWMVTDIGETTVSPPE